LKQQGKENIIDIRGKTVEDDKKNQQQEDLKEDNENAYR